jgi:TPR repeat protein
MQTRKSYRYPSKSELESYISQSNDGDLDSSTYLLWLYVSGPESYRNLAAAKMLIDNLPPHRHARLNLDTADFFYLKGDMQKFEEQLSLAASLDNPIAQLRLAHRKLEIGRPVEAEILPLLRRATALGNIKAQISLGRLLMRQKRWIRIIEGVVIFVQAMILACYYSIANRNSPRVEF